MKKKSEKDRITKSEKDLKKLINDVNEKFKQKYTDNSVFDIANRIGDVAKISTKLNKQLQQENDRINKIEDLVKSIGEHAVKNELLVRNKFYVLYRDIAKVFPSLSNAFRIITTHMISPEGISSGDTYKVVKNNNVESEKNTDENEKAFLKGFMKEYKLAKNAKKFVPSLLRNGEMFFEIVDLEKVRVDISHKDRSLKLKPITESTVDQDFREAINGTTIEFNRYSEDVELLAEARNKYGSNVFDQFLVRKIKPSHIVKLEIEGKEFGYIVVNYDEETELNKFAATNLERQLQQFDNPEDIKTNYYKQKRDKTYAEHKLEKNLIRKIYQEIIDKIDTENVEVAKKLIERNRDLKAFLVHLLLNSKRLEIRYIRPENVVHYKLPAIIEEEDKYGESMMYGLIDEIIDYLRLKKAYNNFLVATAVEKEKVLVNVTTDGDAESAINTVVNTIKTKEAVLEDDLNETGRLPRGISPFKRYYLPRINGEVPVDFESMPNPSSNITKDDIKEARDSILEGLCVPSALLDSRNSTYHTSFTQESMMFAICIFGLQQLYAEYDFELADKVYRKMYGRSLSRNYIFQFNPPKALMLEQMETQVNAVTSIVDFVYSMYVDENLEEPVSYMKKVNIAKALYPAFDWKSFDEIVENDTADWADLVKNINKSDDSGGMSGGY